MPTPHRHVYAGIDTHADTHHVAIIDELGRKLDDAEFPTTPAGYAAILAFITTLGTLRKVGIEGTASYGAGITAHLRSQQIEVREIIRPNRQARRGGKSDPIDAYAAAKAIAADDHDRLPIPKLLGGVIAGLANLLCAYTTAVKARTTAIVQIKNKLVTADTAFRQAHRGLNDKTLIARLAATRPVATDYQRKALRTLARRYQNLTGEIDELLTDITTVVADTAPALAAAKGIGPISAAKLLVTAGENPERIRSKEAFAALCGVSPLQASSGKTNRHRLNRGGNRQANQALHQIVLVRMSSDPRTRAYVARRTAEGKSKREIMRCLKRYIANEAYRHIVRPEPVPAVDDLRPLRQSKKISLETAAGHFNTWPTTISYLERGKRRDDDFVIAYREYLLAA
ncbi:IS110 family transposase [Brevibacterium moorei]|jgi:transposase|uniref:IS110 family transposase n=5 Tax=Brevibacterium TaxID=1696 RepID=UPI00211C32E9|nr:IS110 family transposase [Brevibacterium sp. 68QC2CO]MCQ9387031.1 IS110 family transposase [Brevibacterium sp. 68QC2CO]